MEKEKFKNIAYEEIRPRLGSSCMPQDLPYFTEEENRFRMEVRDFAIEELLPYVNEIEEQDDEQLSAQLASKTAKRGYSNQMIPREWGGGGRNCVAEIIVTEELPATSFVAGALAFASCTFLALPIYKSGTEEMKRNIMAPLLAGEKLGGMAMTEPAAGSDVASTETTAIRDGDDWVLNGEKRFIGNGSTADYLLTFAVTNPEARRATDRLTAFVIDTHQPGFEVVKDCNLMGFRGGRWSWLRYNNLRVPHANILGELNRGWYVAMEELDAERAGAGAIFVGVMRSAYELAAKYSIERRQFGRTIGDFQAISFRLADMYAQIEASRLLAWKCARQVDLARPATKESSAVKVHNSEACIKVVESAFQIIGGNAYTKEYPIDRYMRDSRVFTVFAGTNEIQRVIMSREILKEAKNWPIG